MKPAIPLLAIVFATCPAALDAQAPPAAAHNSGSVAGTVVAANTGQPIAGAVVALESASDVAVVAQSSGSFMGRSFIAVTGPGGEYRFGSLPPGNYHLLVRHMGFHPAVIDVDLARDAPFRVSVALVVNPIRLEALDARATTNEPYGRLRTIADERRFGALDAEQYRDEKFLEGDAAVLTHADVTESVTLGETDLFRAVQRLPGVSTRDDFTAALWTRGAPWSQTRVYFDGLPLFNPVHAVGVFAGVDPDAIGTASFHPGVRSAAIGEGAAGVLNVTSRRASHPGLSGLGELSVISGRTALDWGSPGGRTSFMVAARRSYVDLATRLAESFGVDSGLYMPYDFFDVTSRFDADLGRGVALEASGLLEQDDVRGSIPGLLNNTRGHWGNRLGRVSLVTPIGPLRARTTFGVSDFRGTLGPPPANLAQAPDATPEHAATQNGVRVLSLGTEVAPAGAGTRPTWSAGAQRQVQQQDYVGQFPRPYPVIVLPDSLIMHERLPVVSLWAERRWGLGRYAAIELGLRSDFHRPVLNAPAVGLAPKVALRFTPPGTRVTFTGALQRSWQYTQALAPAGPSVGPDLYVTDVWFLTGDTIPAVRADIATLGAELWIGAGWTASLNLFARRATGVAVPEPAPGPLNDQRPIFVTAVNRAHGVELSARKLVGRWTTSFSYTYGASTLDDVSKLPNNRAFTYPSAADRRHLVDVTAMLRLGAAWRAGAALTAASGAPYSRFLLGVAACDTTIPHTCTLGDTAALTIESPNAERTRPRASLDLLLDWSHDIGHVQIGAYLQVRNVMNSANAVTYAGSITSCTTPHPPTLVATSTPGVCDRFNKGVPLLPLAGFRVAF